MTSDEVDKLWQVSKQIEPLLAGLGWRLQGAVLANLVSLWLAGVYDERGRAATEELRQLAFAEWTQITKDLVPMSEQEILAQYMARDK